MPRTRFYGCFKDKTKAENVARHNGAKVHEIKVNGETRYSVYAKG